MVQAVAFSSVLPRWKSYTQSNSPSRYYVLEKILIPIVLYANRGDGDFFFLSILLNIKDLSPFPCMFQKTFLSLQQNYKINS